MNFDGTSDFKNFRRRTGASQRNWIKEEKSALVKKITVILQKQEDERTEEERHVLQGCTEVAEEVTKRLKRQQQLKSRQEEVEDPPHVLAEKCAILASAIGKAQHLVIYTGAGISTAACIPDYRGPNGVWTRLQQGKDIGSHDLSLAEPTVTHMALSQLYDRGRLKHVVSQNCDGLHLRSGLPRTAISEVHGNMYLEVCVACSPPCEYLRLFDVTERTARYNHRTHRKCHKCGGLLQDTIVHFGERGSLQWPLNWSATSSAAQQADVIVCLGSSLKVLKKYPWLWRMDMPVKKRPLLYIVNLQWTPKDEQATLKINGRCDDVLVQVMKDLNIPIPSYDRVNDPIFSHATPLLPSELRSTTRPFLQPFLDSEKVDEQMADLTQPIIPKCEGDVLENSANNCFENAGPIEPVATLKSECDDSDSNCPLDLTVCVNNSRNVSMSIVQQTDSISYQDNSSLNIDLYSPCNNVSSILSTSNFITEEHNYCIIPEIQVFKGECSFCWSRRASRVCLFYTRKALSNLAVLSESSEEEEPDSGDGSGTSSKPNKLCNPGWFGKGYRKSKLKKRRVT